MSLTYSGLSLRTPLPANTTAPTSEGLRRGALFNSFTGIFEYNCIWLDWKATGSVSMAADTYGVKVEVETIPGETYILRGGLRSGYTNTTQAQAGANKFSTYYVKKDFSMVLSPVLDLSSNPGGTPTFTNLEFTATETKTTIGILIRNAVTGTNGSQLAKVGIPIFSLEQKNFKLPQMLRNNAMQGKLSDHFDLAANSVNAAWFVNEYNETVFVPPVKYLPISFVFSDEKGTDFLEYTDLTPEHATASIVNRVEITNLARNSDGKEDNSETVWEDKVSQQKYGIRNETLTVNVSEWKDAQGLKVLMNDLMDHVTQPRLSIAKIQWNAQQDLYAAARLQLGMRVVVRFRGQEYDAQIANLEHVITPMRWMVNITLRLP